MLFGPANEGKSGPGGSEDAPDAGDWEGGKLEGRGRSQC